MNYSTPTNRLTLFAALVSVAKVATLVTVAGCGQSGPLCGASTSMVDGVCVNNLTVVTCGPNTILDAQKNECVPLLKCGPGTHWDPTTGVCAPDAVCGDGTTLDPATGLCESSVLCNPDTTYNAETGECEPTRFCGPDTELIAGECVPINPCGIGTIFDPATGTCRPELACGDGLVKHLGICLSPADIATLEADAAEPIIDQNDPALGGFPEQVTLEAIGERLIFTGTIGRPTDMNGDGNVDQDLDVWSFAGAAGQLLRIQILSDGAPQPVFMLYGPEGYVRSSRVGGTALHADRWVILPYQGIYQLVIEPASHRASGDLVGGVSHRYVGIIEELPWPTPIDIVPSPAPAETTAIGNILENTANMGKNFFAMAVFESAAVVISAEAQGLETSAVLMAFREDGAFIGEVPLVPRGARQLASQPVAAVPLTNRTVIIVDWTASNGQRLDYELGVSELPVTAFGAVDIGSPVHMPRVTVPAQRFYGFSFAVTAGQVITTHFDGLRSGPLSAFGPRGLLGNQVALEYGAYSFYALDAGTCVWIYVNDGIIDAELSVSTFAETPIVQAPADGVNVVTDLITGPDLQPARRVFDAAWVLLENSAPVLFEASITYGFGTPDLDAYHVNPGGGLSHIKKAGPDDPALVHFIALEPTLHMLRVSGGATAPANPPVRDWQLTLGSQGAPQDREIEPNDTIPFEATDAGLPPLHMLGHLEAGETDALEFNLATPLSPGEALRVVAESLGSATAPQMVISDAILAPLHRREETASRYANAWILFPGEGSLTTGPFFIELSSATETIDYLVSVDRIVMNSEQEVNQPSPQAMDLGDLTNNLPIELYGTTRAGEPNQDFFRFVLPGGLPPNSALLIRASVLATSTATPSEDDLKVLLLDDPTGDPLAAAEGERIALLRSLSGPGPYFIVVEGEGALREDQYRLTLELVTGVETEPNDTVFIATLLNDLAPGPPQVIWGTDVYLGADFYRIAMPPGQALGTVQCGPSPLDLCATEAMSVRWQGMLGQVALEVSVLEADGTLVKKNRGRRGEIVVGPTGFAGSAYYLQITPITNIAVLRPEPYRLEVERIDAIPDIEPNDDELTAQVIYALPAHIRGMSRGASAIPEDPDIYTLSLPRALVANEVLVVRTSVVYTVDPITVTIRDGFFSEIATATDIDPVVEVTPPNSTAGAIYYVEFRASLARTGETSVYDAMVGIETRP